MIRTFGVLVALALLSACSDVHYSDSEMSNVKSSQEDDKGGHPDAPIVE
jgi:major membrane immunogen (membrane-anchored lipoprotein)